MKKLFTVLVAIAIVSSAKAGSGTFEYYIQTTLNGNISYYGDVSGAVSFDNASLGTISDVSNTLVMNLTGLKTWEDGGDVVVSTQMFYRVYQSGGSAGSYTPVNLSNPNGKSGNNRDWFNNTGINLLNGITNMGTYTVEIYYEGTLASGNKIYRSNGGANYKASFTVSVVLPVELTAFTATPKQNEVLLAWETKTELNNGGFEVQRAADGRNFETLATVEGAGTTIEVQKYTYTDAQPLTGVSYYRLKQMDFDGTTEYSQILTVKRENAPQVALFPNPTTEKMTLRTDVQGTANVRIFDLNGRLVYERAQRFDNQLDLNVTELVAGQYFLDVRNNDTQATIYSGTFVKQ